ncbi:hypothetical protein PLEOSDRAFT_1098609 [Pleurotus ostreatus PC15]|uniref:Uncharacterized protein n=1 Tax=Pleurotus ostreatus (strain PC15) TaxID=1137138 RepID=A0A067NXF8_PLEO1|nr:hypothetical protein PLEOSDRAFT_1098609 [Pleurotus ostreatus PC15]
MSATRTHLPTLLLLPSLGKPAESSIPPERPIIAQTLLDIAPDREALFTSGKNVEEIRQTLKIHMNDAYGHWLTTTKRRQGTRYRDRTARTSRFLDKAPLANGNQIQDENEAPEDDVQIVRRVCSAGDLGSFMNSIDNKLNINVSPEGITFDIWGDLRLSSTEKVISPRPLGPTHILVVHQGPLQRTPSRARNSQRESVPDSLELPINDLLFVLNVPNLSPPNRSLSEVPARILPHRLHKELPRVLLCVPHLYTFHELVVYLHTKNQAALFRKIIPEWIRDLMHPLPVAIPVCSSSIAQRSESGSLTPGLSMYQHAPLRKRSTLLSLFDSSSPIAEDANSSAESLLGLPLAMTASFNGSCSSLIDADRSTLSIAKEIADIAMTNYPSDDVLVRTVSGLDALSDNLEYLGYFGKSLWGELLTYKEILVRAIRYKSRLDAAVAAADSP